MGKNSPVPVVSRVTKEKKIIGEDVVSDVD